MAQTPTQIPAQIPALTQEQSGLLAQKAAPLDTLSDATAPNQAVTEAPTMVAAGTLFSSVLWIYLIPLTLVLMLLGLLVVRAMRRRQLVFNEGAAMLATSEQSATPALSLEQAHVVPAVARETSAMISGNVVAQAAATQMVFSANPQASKRECPRCHRLFHAHFELCPYDASALRAAPRNPHALVSRTKSPIQRSQCTNCGRRYENGARYCYIDGLPLIPDTREDAATANAIRVCRSCGVEAKPKEVLCRHDGTELTIIEPSDSTQVAPTIPLLVCKKCRDYAMPGTAFCPNDGELLTPILNARITALPASGFGPRRKLCRKCGTRYSDVCRFCSQDGTRLTPIN